jgi:acylphosphatase
MDQSISERMHVIVDGHVQGVGFRYFVQEHASSLGLTGWVRNTYDGQVELTAEGKHSELEKLLEKVKTGPRSAWVINTEIDWGVATGSFHKFMILPTS